MPDTRSFTEYVSNIFSNQFWAAAEEYLQQNWDSDDYDFYKLHRPGAPEMSGFSTDLACVFSLMWRCP